MYFINERECNDEVALVLKGHKDAIYELAEAVMKLCNDDTDLDLIAEGIIEDLQEVVWYNSDEEPDPEVADMRARAEYENSALDARKERGLVW